MDNVVSSLTLPDNNASFILGLQRPSQDYAPILKILGLYTLADRRQMYGKSFLSYLLLNAIDCLAFLSFITFKIHQYPTCTPIRPTSFHIPQ